MPNGYLVICIDYQKVLCHRLVIFYMTRRWPNCEVDHIDGDRQNNRYSNLRLATRQQNSFNQKVRSDNTSGVRGVLS